MEAFSFWRIALPTMVAILYISTLQQLVLQKPIAAILNRLGGLVALLITFVPTLVLFAAQPVVLPSPLKTAVIPLCIYTLLISLPAEDCTDTVSSAPTCADPSWTFWTVSSIYWCCPSGDVPDNNGGCTTPGNSAAASTAVYQTVTHLFLSSIFYITLQSLNNQSVGKSIEYCQAYRRQYSNHWICPHHSRFLRYSQRQYSGTDWLLRWILLVSGP
jgi:hypothetical protein